MFLFGNLYTFRFNFKAINPFYTPLVLALFAEFAAAAAAAAANAIDGK